jgi:hypothetical protein
MVAISRPNDGCCSVCFGSKADTQIGREGGSIRDLAERLLTARSGR